MRKRIGAAHALGRVLAHPLLRDQLLETHEGRLRRMDPRLRVLAVLDPVVLEPEQPDDQRQGQPLPDEGREDHGEREEEDQVAAGKRGACIRLERERERGRQ